MRSKAFARRSQEKTQSKGEFMATVAQTQRDRKAALAKARAAERLLDSSIEILERRMTKLRAKKKLIQPNDAMTLDPLWRNVTANVSKTERALADFIGIVTI